MASNPIGNLTVPNNTAFGVEAQSAGPLGALGANGPMDLEALIFAVMSMRMQDCDATLERQIGQMKQNIALKNAYQTRIDELNRLSAGETVEVDLTLEEAEVRDFMVNEKGEVVPFINTAEDTDGEGHIANEDEETSDGAIEASPDAVKKEVERLQGKLDGLNADSEIDMMRLNQTIARRQQVTTLFSNMMSNFNQTAMSVISNIK